MCTLPKNSGKLSKLQVKHVYSSDIDISSSETHKVVSEPETESKSFKTLLSNLTTKLSLLLWYYFLSRRLIFQCIVKLISNFQINITIKWKEQSKGFAKWKYRLGTSGKMTLQSGDTNCLLQDQYVRQGEKKMPLCDIFFFLFVYFSKWKAEFQLQWTY